MLESLSDVDKHIRQGLETRKMATKYYCSTYPNTHNVFIKLRNRWVLVATSDVYVALQVSLLEIRRPKNHTRFDPKKKTLMLHTIKLWLRRV
jgi:hypothetical protein